MDEILAAIDEALARKGLSDAAASKLAVGNYALIKNLRSSRATSPEDRRTNFHALQRLADVLGLECYFGPPREAGTVQQIVLDGADFAQVPVHEADLAAGVGRENHTEVMIGHLAFRRSWLKRIGVSAASAVLARSSGESMAPTIHDGDMLLIDRSKSEPPIHSRGPKDTRPASIYAILDDGAARVKRIELAPAGTLALLSDNPAFAPEFRPISSVSIIGKVMWWGHTNRD
ncbi:S24 family peptidase [Tabrizicola fusiformis]|uniref:S24 family peptidase n=1 Tax=Tabrizicola sp. SY72 TaxID=2741673 RepID=UPI001573E242|nr:S24 family peptidase [Tabrizicola sp. SY72]NTT88132.1 helix-turn-helix transcriptional regulator [Tabrizicola sp. SY72]